MKRFITIFLISVFLPSILLAQTNQACLDISTNLKYRQKDQGGKTEILLLQNFLKTSGYLNANPTGYFGDQTLKSVKAFQKAKNINPTGLVGPLTRASIKNSSCDLAVQPTPEPSVPTPEPVIPTLPVPTIPVVNDEIISSGNSSSLRARTDGVIVFGTTSATLRGQITAGARSGTVGFFEITTNPLVYKTSETIVSTKVVQRSNDRFDITVSGLIPNTNYYFRACAENTSLGQKSCGGNSSFKTLN